MVCSSKKNCFGKELLNISNDALVDAKTYTGIDAFRYLALVASSLDSSTIGEPEILGQFKRAFVSQQEAKTLSGSLCEIITNAYKTGKKVHTSSGIPKGRISILSNAEKIFNDWIQESAKINDQDVSIAIVGTGKMGRDAYKYFKSKYSSIKVFSRNRTDLTTEITELKIEPFDSFLNDLKDDQFDVLILCSSTNDPFLTPELLQNPKQILIFDVGIPKNADPSISSISCKTLYQMDQLVQLSALNYSKREEGILLAHEIINEQVMIVTQLFEKKIINPFIKDLRIDLEKVAKKRLDDYASTKNLPIEFYKWFNNTIKEMMHVSQQHLEKGLNENPKLTTNSNEPELKDFQIVDSMKQVNEHRAI